MWERSQDPDLKKTATCGRRLSTVSSLYSVPRGLAADALNNYRLRKTGLALSMAANEREVPGVSLPAQIRRAVANSLSRQANTPLALAAYVRHEAGPPIGSWIRKQPDDRERLDIKVGFTMQNVITVSVTPNPMPRCPEGSGRSGITRERIETDGKWQRNGG